MLLSQLQEAESSSGQSISGQLGSLMTPCWANVVQPRHNWACRSHSEHRSNDIITRCKVEVVVAEFFYLPLAQFWLLQKRLKSIPHPALSDKCKGIPQGFRAGQLHRARKALEGHQNWLHSCCNPQTIFWITVV